MLAMEGLRDAMADVTTNPMAAILPTSAEDIIVTYRGGYAHIRAATGPVGASAYNEPFEVWVETYPVSENAFTAMSRDRLATPYVVLPAIPL